MQIWVVSVVVLFVGIQAYQWLSQLAIPLPIYGVAGLLLAIASNATIAPNDAIAPNTPITPNPTAAPEPPTAPIEAKPLPKASISFKISRDT